MQIIKSGITRPPIITLYAKQKIGKSLFASKFSNVVFLPTEDGLQGIPGVSVLRENPGRGVEIIKSVNEMERKLDWLITEDHEFNAACIDSLDVYQKIIHAQALETLGWTDINPPGSYGRGGREVMTHWDSLMQKILLLNESRKMTVINLCHCKIVDEVNAAGENYQKFGLFLDEKAAGLFLFYSDIIAYATQKVFVNERKEAYGSKRKTATTNDERVMYLTKKPAWEAGNRYGLPDEMPLEPAPLIAALKEAKAAQKSQLSKTNEKPSEKIEEITTIEIKTETKIENQPQPEAN